jgi:hypothetical protein
MKEEATEVRFTTETTLPAEFATLLVPIGLSPEGANAQARLTQFLPSPGMSVYRFVDNREDHCFIFAHDKTWMFHEWKSDAEFLYSCSANGVLNLLIFCNGTHVEFHGNRIVTSPKRVLRCEIIYSQGKTLVLSSEDNILVSQEGMRKSFETRETAPQKSGEVDR